MENNNNVILSDWSIIGDTTPSNKYKPKNRMALQGNVYNHPYHKDGTFVITSEIKELNYKEKKALTVNTEYLLKEPNKKWSEWLKTNGYKIEDYSFYKVPFHQYS